MTPLRTVHQDSGSKPQLFPLPQGCLGMGQGVGWLHDGDSGSAERLPWAPERLELPQDCPTTPGELPPACIS